MSLNLARLALAQLLRSRKLSVGDYDGLTYVEFETDDALYDYLGRVYSFIFEGAQEPPKASE